MTIQQSQSNDEIDKFWYEVFINGESKWKLVISSNIIHTVQLYTSNPWEDSFTSEFGSVCNLKIQKEVGPQEPGPPEPGTISQRMSLGKKRY